MLSASQMGGGGGVHELNLASLFFLFYVCPGVFLIHSVVRDIFGSRLGHAIV